LPWSRLDLILFSWEWMKVFSVILVEVHLYMSNEALVLVHSHD
jgi:hypothetical protein